MYPYPFTDSTSSNKTGVLDRSPVSGQVTRITLTDNSVSPAKTVYVDLDAALSSNFMNWLAQVMAGPDGQA